MNRGAFAALLRRELKAYFQTPAAYIVAAVFLLITGYFFAQTLFLVNRPNLDSVAGLVPLLFVFFVPAITMRLIAEEFKNGTIELLATMPVDEAEVVLAKFIAALSVVTLTLALTFPYPLSIGLLGNVDWGGVAGLYLGLWLTGALMAAFGLFASTLAKNQIISFIIAFMACFTVFLLGKLNQFAPLSLQNAIGYLGIDAHIDNMMRGLFDTRDLLYFAVLGGFSLLCATVNLRARRWRG